MSADQSHTFVDAPIEDLLYVVLRQLKRPLESHGLSITDAEAKQLAAERAAGKSLDVSALLPALVAVVTESEQVLERMDLTFTESLDKGMDQLAGWETTAEFLELANEKSNAELRISLASAVLLAFGGDRHFAPYLLHVAGGDYGDETVIVRRILLFAAGIAPDAPDALSRAKTWLVENNQ